jgi:hypothetical protein
MRGFEAMASRRLVALAAGCAAAAVPATAKPLPPVPSWKQSHLEEGGNLTVRSVYSLAVCLRARKRQAAEALLGAAPGSAEENALLHAAIPSGQTDCPIRNARLVIHSAILLRGAIAEALYNGDGVKPRAASALPDAEPSQPFEQGSAMGIGRRVARCAVRREPRLAHEVLKWNIGAFGEERALRALKPVFIACLPPGERLQVARINIRALIAEELYRASVTFKESFVHAHG